MREKFRLRLWNNFFRNKIQKEAKTSTWPFKQFVDGLVIVEADDDSIPDEAVSATLAELAGLGHDQQVDQKCIEDFVIFLKMLKAMSF